MSRHTVTFGQRYRYERHPFFGDCPTLPDGYGYVDAPDHRRAHDLVVAAFGNHWSMLYIGDAEHQAAEWEPWPAAFHAGLLFHLRADPAGQPVITFPAPTPSTIDRTTIPEPCPDHDPSDPDGADADDCGACALRSGWEADHQDTLEDRA